MCRNLLELVAEIHGATDWSVQVEPSTDAQLLHTEPNSEHQTPRGLRHVETVYRKAGERRVGVKLEHRLLVQPAQFEVSVGGHIRTPIQHLDSFKFTMILGRGSRSSGISYY